MKIDVTDTGFEYDVAVCDKYFELVGCIIDRDTNENYTKEMRMETINRRGVVWDVYGKIKRTWKKFRERRCKFVWLLYKGY